MSDPLDSAKNLFNKASKKIEESLDDLKEKAEEITDQKGSVNDSVMKKAKAWKKLAEESGGEIYDKYVGGRLAELPRNCEHCLAPAGSEDDHCKQCGGQVKVLEPWVLLCGWCGASNRRDQVTHCKKCGGELPDIPGSDRAPKPAPAPREVSKKYVKEILFTKNNGLIISTIILVAFGWTVIFGAIAVYFMYRFYSEAHYKVMALKNGVATKGVITEIGTDHSVNVNGKSPVLIWYDFETPNGKHEGWVNTWDETNRQRKIGENIWVVFNPKNLEHNNIWPPLRYGKAPWGKGMQN